MLASYRIFWYSFSCGSLTFVLEHGQCFRACGGLSIGWFKVSLQPWLGMGSYGVKYWSMLQVMISWIQLNSTKILPVSASGVYVLLGGTSTGRCFGRWQWRSGFGYHLGCLWDHTLTGWGQWWWCFGRCDFPIVLFGWNSIQIQTRRWKSWTTPKPISTILSISNTLWAELIRRWNIDLFLLVRCTLGVCIWCLSITRGSKGFRSPPRQARHEKPCSFGLRK